MKPDHVDDITEDDFCSLIYLGSSLVWLWLIFAVAGVLIVATGIPLVRRATRSPIRRCCQAATSVARSNRGLRFSIAVVNVK